jgi:hypothetical protein
MTTQQIPPARSGGDTRSRRIAAALVERGIVAPDRHHEAELVVDRVLGTPDVGPAPLKRRLAELAGYVGGALVVAAGALFVADQWLNLSVAQQVGLLAGIAVLLFAAGMAVGVTGGGLAVLHDGTQPVRQRLASVLFTAGAVAASAAVIVWLMDVIDSRGTEMEEGSLVGVGGSLTLVVLATVGYLLAPSLVGQAGVAVGAAYGVAFILDSFGDIDILWVGMFFIALGVMWLALAERRLWHEVLAGRIIGSAFVLVGAQLPIGSDHAWVGYLATLLVAAGGFAMYVGRRAWPYLAVGVIGVTLAVPEALLDWTEGSLGTAGVLLVAGVTLLGASLLGLRLRKEVEETSTD